MLVPLQGHIAPFGGLGLGKARFSAGGFDFVLCRVFIHTGTLTYMVGKEKT